MSRSVRFEFATAARVVFGAGALREVGANARSMGTRALVVTGRSKERAEPLLKSLAAEKLIGVVFSVPGEPTTDVVSLGVQHARAEGCDLVIGFGGGSALDAAKAIAVLLTNGGELFDYLEVIGQGKSLTQPAAPCIAIPTTAGTGTEVTRNSVLASPAHQMKASLRGPFLLPRLAVVDPELTCDLPPALTASTGLDALTQLIEPYVSHRANPMTDAVCVDGMRRVARALRRACEWGQDMAAREDMALASLFGGLALANAGLGAVHGFAAPIGGMFPAPHGAVCAALLPHVMEFNLQALRERAPASDSLRRYEEAGRILTGDQLAGAAEGVAWVCSLCAALNIPGLRTYGVEEKDFPVLVAKAGTASSMKANPIVLTPDEMREILARAW